MSRLYSRKEAAAELSICLRLLDELLRRRAIEYVKIGASVRISAESLQAFITKHSIPAI